ncbi:hypothetical protein ABID22_003795 [Pontibacter aydingkolensis]
MGTIGIRIKQRITNNETYRPVAEKTQSIASLQWQNALL